MKEALPEKVSGAAKPKNPMNCDFHVKDILTEGLGEFFGSKSPVSRKGFNGEKR